MNRKLQGNRERGDAEIWFIHPYERTLTVWRRQPDGSYAEKPYQGGGGLAGRCGFGGSNASAGQSQGCGIGGMLDNPVAKVAMTGVAAMVAKKLTDPTH